MTPGPTVLVLGAGASKPYGFPTGEELKERVQDFLSFVCAGQVANVPPVAETFVRLFHEVGCSRDEATGLLERLGDSQRHSIDAFLEFQSEPMRRLGKLCIAGALASCEDLKQLQRPRVSSWYRALYNGLVQDGPGRILENNVTVVTFNYDTSLETLLEKALQADFGMSPAEASQALSALTIVHVYGKLGPHTYGDWGKVGLDLLAQGIGVVTDALSPDDSNLRLARRAIKNADRIFFLGFGYDHTNLERIFDARPGTACAGTGFGLGNAPRTRVTRYMQQKSIELQLLQSHQDAYALFQELEVFQ